MGRASVEAVVGGVPVVVIQDEEGLTLVEDGELAGLDGDETRTEELHATKLELGVAETEGDATLELGVTAAALPPAMLLYGITPG